MTHQGRVPAGFQSDRRRGRARTPVPAIRPGQRRPRRVAVGTGRTPTVLLSPFLADRYGTESLDTRGRIVGTGAVSWRPGVQAGLRALARRPLARFRGGHVRARGCRAYEPNHPALTRHGFSVAAPRYGADGTLYYSVANPHGFPAFDAPRYECIWRRGQPRDPVSGEHFHRLLLAKAGGVRSTGVRAKRRTPVGSLCAVPRTGGTARPPDARSTRRRSGRAGGRPHHRLHGPGGPRPALPGDDADAGRNGRRAPSRAPLVSEPRRPFLVAALVAGRPRHRGRARVARGPFGDRARRSGERPRRAHGGLVARQPQRVAGVASRWAHCSSRPTATATGFASSPPTSTRGQTSRLEDAGTNAASPEPSRDGRTLVYVGYTPGGLRPVFAAARVGALDRRSPLTRSDPPAIMETPLVPATAAPTGYSPLAHHRAAILDADARIRRGRARDWSGHGRNRFAWPYVYGVEAGWSTARARPD